MAIATILTDRFDRALLYATHVHGGQVRKGTSTPYVAHLLAVAATVLEYGGDEDLAIAALLHDTVEDQGGSARLEDIRNRFGERVARIVAACSDSLANTSSGERKAHWQERKEAYVAHLGQVDDDILRVSLADKVHNARAMLRDLRKHDLGDHAETRRPLSEAAKVLPPNIAEGVAIAAKAIPITGKNLLSAEAISAPCGERDNNFENRILSLLAPPSQAEGFNVVRHRAA
jgi:hypothetical protein